MALTDDVEARLKLDVSESGAEKLDLVKAGLLGVVGAAASLVAGAGVAVKAYNDFEESMLHLKNSAGLTEAQLKQTKTGMEQLALAGPKSMDELASAYEVVGQMGTKGAAAFNEVKVAMEGATVTGTNTADMARLLATSLKDFHQPTQDAAHDMDILLAASQHTVGGMQAFSAVFPRLAEAGHQAGLSIQETAAAFSVLASTGMPAGRAASSLQQALLALEAPTTKAATAMQEMGKAAGVDLVGDIAKLQNGTGSFSKVLQDLSVATGGNSAALKDLGLSSRTLLSVQALMTNGAQAFTAAMQSEAQAAGLTARQFDEQNKTLDSSISRIKNLANVVLVELGSKIAPVLAGALSSVVDWATKVVNNPQVQHIASGISDAIGSGFRTIGATLSTAFAAIGAAVTKYGPAIESFSKMVGTDLKAGFDAIGTWITQHKADFEAFARTLGVDIAEAFQRIGTEAQTHQKDVQSFGDSLKSLGQVSVDKLQGFAQALEKIGGDVVHDLQGSRDFRDALQSIADTGGKLVSDLEHLGVSFDGVGGKSGNTAKQFQQIASVISDVLIVAVRLLSAAFSGLEPLIVGAVSLGVQSFHLLAQGILDITTVVKDFGTLLYDVFHGNFDKIEKDLGAFDGAVLGLFGDLFSNLLGMVKTELSATLMSFGNFFTTLTGHSIPEFVAAAATAFGELPSKLLEIAAQMEIALLKGIGSMLEHIVTDFLALPGRILGALGNLVGDVTKPFLNLADMLIGHSIVPDMLDAIVGAFARLPGRIVGALGNLVGDVTGVFTSLGSSLLSTAGGIISDVTGAFGGLASKVGGALSGVKNAITAPFSGAWDALTGHSIVPDMVRDIVDVWSTLPAKIAAVSGEIQNALTAPFGAAASQIGSQVGSAAAAALHAASAGGGDPTQAVTNFTAATNTSTQATTAHTAAITTATTATQQSATSTANLDSAMSTASSGIGSATDAVTKGMGNVAYSSGALATQIQQAGRDVGSALQSAATDALSGLGSDIATAVQSAVDAAQSGITAAAASAAVTGVQTVVTVMTKALDAVNMWGAIKTKIDHDAAEPLDALAIALYNGTAAEKQWVDAAVRGAQEQQRYADAQAKATQIVDLAAGDFKGAIDSITATVKGSLDQAMAKYALDLMNHTGNLEKDAEAIQRAQAQTDKWTEAESKASAIAAQRAQADQAAATAAEHFSRAADQAANVLNQWGGRGGTGSQGTPYPGMASGQYGQGGYAGAAGSLGASGGTGGVTLANGPSNANNPFAGGLNFGSLSSAMGSGGWMQSTGNLISGQVSSAQSQYQTDALQGNIAALKQDTDNLKQAVAVQANWNTQVAKGATDAQILSGDFVSAANSIKQAVQGPLDQGFDQLFVDLQKGSGNISQDLTNIAQAAVAAKTATDNQTKATILGDKAMGNFAGAVQTMQSQVQGNLTNALSAVVVDISDTGAALGKDVGAYVAAYGAAQDLAQKFAQAAETVAVAAGDFSTAFDTVLQGLEKTLQESKYKLAYDLDNHTGSIEADTEAVQRNQAAVDAWNHGLDYANKVAQNQQQADQNSTTDITGLGTAANNTAGALSNLGSAAAGAGAGGGTSSGTPNTNSADLYQIYTKDQNAYTQAAALYGPNSMQAVALQGQAQSDWSAYEASLSTGGSGGGGQSVQLNNLSTGGYAPISNTSGSNSRDRQGQAVGSTQGSSPSNPVYTASAADAAALAAAQAQTALMKQQLSVAEAQKNLAVQLLDYADQGLFESGQAGSDGAGLADMLRRIVLAPILAPKG